MVQGVYVIAVKPGKLPESSVGNEHCCRYAPAEIHSILRPSIANRPDCCLQHLQQRLQLLMYIRCGAKGNPLRVQWRLKACIC